MMMADIPLAETVDIPLAEELPRRGKGAYLEAEARFEAETRIASGHGERAHLDVDVYLATGRGGKPPPPHPLPKPTKQFFSWPERPNPFLKCQEKGNGKWYIEGPPPGLVKTHTETGLVVSVFPPPPIEEFPRHCRRYWKDRKINRRVEGETEHYIISPYQKLVVMEFPTGKIKIDYIPISEDLPELPGLVDVKEKWEGKGEEEENMMDCI
jgi:hypothetical protein